MITLLCLRNPISRANPHHRMRHLCLHRRLSRRWRHRERNHRPNMRFTSGQWMYRLGAICKRCSGANRLNRLWLRRWSWQATKLEHLHLCVRDFDVDGRNPTRLRPRSRPRSRSPLLAFSSPSLLLCAAFESSGSLMLLVESLMLALLLAPAPVLGLGC